MSPQRIKSHTRKGRRVEAYWRLNRWTPADELAANIRQMSNDPQTLLYQAAIGLGNEFRGEMRAYWEEDARADRMARAAEGIFARERGYPPSPEELSGFLKGAGIE